MCLAIYQQDKQMRAQNHLRAEHSSQWHSPDPPRGMEALLRFYCALDLTTGINSYQLQTPWKHNYSILVLPFGEGGGEER